MSTTTEDRDTTRAPAGSDPFAAAISALTQTLAAVADVPAWTLTERTQEAHLTALLGIRASVEERLAGASSPRSWLSAPTGFRTPTPHDP